MEYISAFLKEFFALTRTVLPYFLGGAAAGAALDVFFKRSAPSVAKVQFRLSPLVVKIRPRRFECRKTPSATRRRYVLHC